ncbi:MAG: nitrite/sulfite reductase [Deltaproteobacteria bacterium]|nr:nitrite/sulfite reductase [Deltaproteobacteria bacterium]
MSVREWKVALRGELDELSAKEVDEFELAVELRKSGKLDERVFAEARLRRGVYGQRYDNGKRQDGSEAREIGYSQTPTKGPSTIWDAPGMQRVKVPFGGLVPAQLEVIAELAEEYSDGIAHVTTRQDFQFHFVHIEDTPDLMRRLAAVGITTKEACGNSVRNVTSCPIAGVCRGETFDVTPAADALSRFLLGHPDTQDMGRKFKIAFSGCREEACGLASMHDLGFVAAREGDELGFTVYVGGGLGAVPHQARVLYPFLSATEILPVAQSVCRIFSRLGERKNRARARLKFLVEKLGVEELRRLVEEDRETLAFDPRWAEWVQPALVLTSGLVQLGRAATGTRTLHGGTPADAEFSRWCASNVSAQRQGGFSVVTIALPLGDVTSRQLRGVADIGREFLRPEGSEGYHPIRTSVEQNIVLRWVREQDLRPLHEALSSLGLALPHAGTIVDVTSCPGTDTCKLGISSSRGLAGELRSRLAAKGLESDESVRDLRIKVSGCFNSCGQHHVADLGFYGVSRKKGSHTVPHFQVVLGGEWANNAGAFGLAIGAVPSKAIPEVVDRLLSRYTAERQQGEGFRAFVERVGKANVRVMIEDLMEVPSYEVDRSFYSDWNDPREYSMADHGVGECAGAVVSRTEFGLDASERRVFEAQLRLEAKDFEIAVRTAYDAMVTAAKALLESQGERAPDDPAEIIESFQTRFYDTRLFFDPFAGGKFASYLFRAHERPVASGAAALADAHRRVEEAQVFIEAAHACYERITAAARRSHERV